MQQADLQWLGTPAAVARRYHEQGDPDMETEQALAMRVALKSDSRVKTAIKKVGGVRGSCRSVASAAAWPAGPGAYTQSVRGSAASWPDS